MNKVQAFVEMVLDALAAKKLEQQGQAAIKKATDPKAGIRNLDLLGGTIGRIAGLFGTAFTVGMAFRKFIEETSAAQKAHAQLEAVIKSTGGAAGRTVEQIEGLSASLARTTAFGDDTVSAMQGVLLTFKGIRGDTFDRATESILDMSQALGTDLQASAIQVGKALNDPIKGITALQRVGVSFTESQKNVIKSLVETGEAAKAQALILDELESEFGGSAEAFRKTLPGALAALREEWGNLFEVSAESSQGIISAINGIIFLLPKIRSFIDTVAKGWAALGIHAAVAAEQIKLLARALDPRRLWSDDAQERFEQQKANLERMKDAAMDMMFELEHGAPPAAAATRDVADALGEESQSAEEAAEASKKLREAEDKRLSLLVRGRELSILSKQEMVELTQAYLDGAKASRDLNASLEDRARGADRRNTAAGALGLNDDVAGRDLKMSGLGLGAIVRPISTQQVGTRTTQDLVSQEGEFTKFFLDNLDTMTGAAQMAALSMQESFSRSFSALFTEGQGFAAFFKGIFKGIAGAAIGALAELATRKVTENIALAAENFAKAAAANALLPGSGGGFIAAAKMHLGAAAKWGLLGAGTAAASGALAGDGGGGGGFRGQDVTGRAVDRLDTQPNVLIVKLDGFDPRNPAKVELLAAGLAEVERQWGGQEPNVRIFEAG